jgi:intracellular sulfur oxidation DsrE/DsrF family protein
MNNNLKALAVAVVWGVALPSFAQYVEPKIQHEPYGEQKVVYQINEGNRQKFLAVLKNILNQQAVVGKDRLTASVVVHGEGIRLLEDAQAPAEIADQGAPKDYQQTLRQRIDALRKSGVRFLVCNETLKGHDLDWHTLYGVRETDIVPSGVAELTYLQQKGFAYLKP